MKSVAFHNLGCKVNGYEMDYMQQILKEKGYNIVPFSEKADIYIINTCTVTNIADRKSRQMLHRAKKRNPEWWLPWAAMSRQARRTRLRI